MAACTRVRVGSDTWLGVLMARETVIMDTPACSATSRKVTTGRLRIGSGVSGRVLGEGAASAESIHEAMIPQDGRLAVGQKPPSSPSCGAPAEPVLLDGVHVDNDSPGSMSNH